MSSEQPNDAAEQGPPPSTDAAASPVFAVENHQTPAAEASPGVDLEQKRFAEAIAAAPRSIVTPTLIAINVAVFGLMIAKGVSPVEPTVDSLLRWGADYAPLTTHGQWWRMLTSTFLHIGFIHIAMNMFILWGIGMFTEKLFGRVGFLVLYLLSGIGGSLLSLAWHPMTVSAGASGAIFGLYGGLFGFLLVQRNFVPRNTIQSLAKNAAIFVGYNLIYGLGKTGVDMGAHAGGIVSGFVLGAALALPLPAEFGLRMRRNLIVGVAGTALAVAAFTRIPVLDDLQAEIAQFGPIESKSLKLYDDTLDQIKADKITPQEFAKVVDEQILPPWNQERERLTKLRTTGQQQTVAHQLLSYVSLRIEGWSLMAKGVLANDLSLVQQANQKQTAAGEALASLNQGSK